MVGPSIFPDSQDLKIVRFPVFPDAQVLSMIVCSVIQDSQVLKMLTNFKLRHPKYKFRHTRHKLRHLKCESVFQNTNQFSKNIRPDTKI